MRVPFVSFLPLEHELDKDLRSAFNRVYTRSWYIEGVEDENFEKSFAQYCDTKYCVGVGNGLDALILRAKISFFSSDIYQWLFKSPRSKFFGTITQMF